MTIKQWIADLRSGRWKQGFGALYDGECFCVMGTLADALGVEWKRDPDDGYYYELSHLPPYKVSILSYYELLDRDTAKATGFGGLVTKEISRYVKGRFPSFDHISDGWKITELFVTLNDDYRIPFRDLANLAEWLYNRGYIYEKDNGGDCGGADNNTACGCGSESR